MNMERRTGDRERPHVRDARLLSWLAEYEAGASKQELAEKYNHSVLYLARMLRWARLIKDRRGRVMEALL